MTVLRSLEWPPRSHDLLQLDFFQWDYLNSKMYATKLESLDDFRNRIINECSQVTPERLNNIRKRFEKMYMIALRLMAVISSIS